MHKNQGTKGMLVHLRDSGAFCLVERLETMDADWSAVAHKNHISHIKDLESIEMPL